MKKIFRQLRFLVLVVTFLLIYTGNAGAQKNIAKSWTTDNPFKTDVFIENYGQFDNWAETAGPVKYAVNNNDKIFFTSHGLTFRLENPVKMSIEEWEEIEKGKNKGFFQKPEPYYVSLQWEGCNANPVLEAGEPSEGYYTFGEKGYENVKAKGYKKLLYKNLYNGIDVEYIIPETCLPAGKEGGIKYSLIVHPGADIKQVKMKYSGDVSKIKTNENGNILIETPVGTITDHAPVSYYENSKTAAGAGAVWFELKDNTVSFKLQTPNLPTGQAGSKFQTLIIDPWTTMPDSLKTNNIAYDMDFDDFGNVYVSGGTVPFKISKYSTSGSHTWTFTVPHANWGSCAGVFGYTKFCVIPESGTLFLGEAYEHDHNIPTDPHYGPRVMKIDKYGNLVYTTPDNQFSGTQEMWVMFYNRCIGQLTGFGGGTYTPNNIMQTDTSLSFGTVNNFNGYGSTNSNDIASVIMDYNGDFYTLMSSLMSASSNRIQKSLISNNYNLPLAFDINSGYSFLEMYNSGIIGLPGPPPSSLSGPLTVRANTLALNNKHLYSYDGRTIKVWDKTNGAGLDSIVINPLDSCGRYRTFEGIAVDQCDNIYVGGNKKVDVYSYNSSTHIFTFQTPITTDIKDVVYDVRLDKLTKTLYVCGNGFVTVTQALDCFANELFVTTSVTSCPGSAEITNVTGGAPPYTYLWSNGATTTGISGIPDGYYTVVVTDSTCIPLHGLDTVYINNNTISVSISNNITICDGENTTLSASGATDYSWSPSEGLTSTTGASVMANPTTTTTYTVTGTSLGCTNTAGVTVTVTPMPAAVITGSSQICAGTPVTLTASGGAVYLWSTAETPSSIVVNPVSDTSYTVTVSNPGCSSTAGINIALFSLPHADAGKDTLIAMGQSTQLNATGTGGTTFTWSPATYLDNPNIFNPKVTLPLTDMTYVVTVTDANGCTDSDTVLIKLFLEHDIYIPNAFSPDHLSSGNEKFYVQGHGVEKLDLIIYDRWGEKMYEITQLGRDNGWDGTYKGKKLSPAVFVYYVKYKFYGEEPVEQKGNITLIR